MSKNYGNLNSIAILPELQISNVKTLEVGKCVYSVLIFNENVRSLRSPYRAVVE